MEQKDKGDVKWNIFNILFSIEKGYKAIVY